MINSLKHKLIIISSFSSLVGVTGGFLFGNRVIFIKYGEKPNTLVLRHSIPLISALTCSFLFPTLLICSPIIAIDYYGNLCAVDKITDRIHSKYLFEYKRYHQYDGNNNKYYAPSNLHITIKNKESLLEKKIKNP